MKMVRVEDALGMVVAHDLTKIVPGEFKGARFKKGHIIKGGDIAELKSMGKNHIYILELKEGILHEEQCAERIGQAIYGENSIPIAVGEGKVNIISNCDGIVKINIDALEKINSINNIIVSTIHNNSVVKKGDILAACKVIPLVLDEKYIIEVEDIMKTSHSVISVKEFQDKKVGMVVTGTEVYEGRIKDKFAPIIKEKIEIYNCKVYETIFTPDDLAFISEGIESLINKGCDFIITSGGMSVDADDVTPKAIAACVSEVITYGSPVIPGAMFMLAYKDDVTIVGLPACGMFSKTTVFDILLPRIICNDKISKKDIVKLSHGGLCLKCETCHYPICPFGK